MRHRSNGRYLRFTLDKKALVAVQKAVPALKSTELRFSETVDVPVFDIGIKGLEALVSHYSGAGDEDRVAKILALKEALEHSSTAKFGPRMLRALEPALRQVIGKVKNRWLYEREATGQALAWLVTDVEFHEPERSPVYVSASLQSWGLGGVRSCSIRLDADDLRGQKTIPEMLATKGYLLQNDRLDALYKAAISKYEKWWNLTGVQFRAQGFGIKEEYRYDRTALGIGGSGDKVVADYDAMEKKERESYIASGQSWGHDEERDDSEEDGISFPLPVHPFIHCFHLSMHVHMWVHVNGLKEYVYKPELKEKLILPQAHRDLIDVLTTESVLLREDIIEGKAGGTTIMCQGDPGTGKTLTAEVYAEVIGRPLYKLHSGQLGTDPKSVEENIIEALKNAERWKAIMLIDEADVYVRNRAENLDQNAVVGVFLRTLEYFNGLLFLTTNRGQDIDDAILSRCIAVIQYEKPDEEVRRELWTTLAEQFGVKMSQQLVLGAAATFKGIAGRDIKAYLKLSAKWCEVKKQPLSLGVLEKAAFFRGYKEAA